MFIQPGVCAKCGSENIDYHLAEPDDSMLCYPYDCLDCGVYGEEWYELVFIENKVEEEGEE
jgi:hypothetical protein